MVTVYRGCPRGVEYESSLTTFGLESGSRWWACSCMATCSCMVLWYAGTHDSSNASSDLVDLGKSLRGIESSIHAPGLQSFEGAYMPWCSGFRFEKDEMAAYRSTRKFLGNPTAAASDEEISYYYTLDNGEMSTAAGAANPLGYREHVRNSKTASHGGFFRRMMRPVSWYMFTTDIIISRDESINARPDFVLTCHHATCCFSL